MRTLRSVGSALLSIGLAAWLAAIVAAAIAAMNVFGTLDDIALQTTAYPEFSAAEQSRLVAGRIMQGVFSHVDWLMYAAATISIIGLLIALWSRSGWRRPSMLLTTVCVAIAVTCCVLYGLMSPELQALLYARFEAADAGDVDQARQITAIFDPLHDRANTLFQIQLVAVLAAIIAHGSRRTFEATAE